ncbi:MAG: patatin-like phospholipase family protein [Spirochaetales bacterium]|nr:patatin-like phospholipase family protein [Spirochaetales bacterium]
MKDDGYALVLSGGGAKGVYHIGAWQALREVGIKISAVIGSSVGAIVAGFVAQGEYKKADSILKNIGIGDIVTIPDQLIKDGQIEINRKNLKYINKLQKDVQQKGGFDNQPLRRMLEMHLDEEKIRNSGMDFGIVTYQVNELKPTEIFIEDMEHGYLLDYILASATLPGFTMTEIKKKKFIDGGIYNNIPFSLAKERGYKKIIVIDISGIGWNKRPDIRGTDTIYIKNSIKMGSLLDFDKKFLRDYRELGYLDTLKVFGKIDGIDYFYHSDKKLYAALDRLLYDDTTRVDYSPLLEFSGWKKGGTNRELQIRGLLPKEMRLYRQPLYCLAECAAWSLNIKKLKLYTFKELVKAIREKYLEVEKNLLELEKHLSAKTVKELINNIIYLSKHTDVNELLETSVYEYDRILGKILKMVNKKIPFSTLSFFYPRLPPAKLFLILLNKYYD